MNKLAKTAAVERFDQQVTPRFEVVSGKLQRQVAQILFALDSLDRRKPQERKRKFLMNNQWEA